MNKEIINEPGKYVMKNGGIVNIEYISNSDVDYPCFGVKENNLGYVDTWKKDGTNGICGVSSSDIVHKLLGHGWHSLSALAKSGYGTEEDLNCLWSSLVPSKGKRQTIYDYNTMPRKELHLDEDGNLPQPPEENNPPWLPAGCYFNEVEENKENELVASCYEDGSLRWPVDIMMRKSNFVGFAYQLPSGAVRILNCVPAYFGLWEGKEETFSLLNEERSVLRPFAAVFEKRTEK
jgi:hypothetical protein